MMKSLATLAVLLVFMLSLIGLSAVAALAANETTIFIYHRFGESRYPATNISAETFSAQLDYLNQNNYQVMTLSDAVSRLESGVVLPEKSVVLTVDDAFASFLKIGLPIIEKYGYPVTLFVNTESVGRPGYLGWDDLRGIASRGVEIGSHGHAHLHMTEILMGESEAEYRQRINADLNLAQSLFQKKLQLQPDLFAYPYGEYSPELLEIIKTAGFRAAVAQQSGSASHYTDQYLLPRFPMGGPFATLEGFVSKAAMHSMPIEVLQPVSPIVGTENPPTLEVQVLDLQQVDLNRMNCFVNGRPDCQVEQMPDKAGHYRVISKEPLSGRRSKYTLTAPRRKSGWYWFSQLWIVPGNAGDY